MPKSEQLCIVVPTRNAPPQRCVDIAAELATKAAVASFDYVFKIIFLVNDSDPSVSTGLEEVLTSNKPSNIDIGVIRSDKDYPTVEENIKGNLSREIERLPEKFLLIGNSDTVEFGALSRALDYMNQHCIDLLLIGVENREAWEGKIVRKLHTTPGLFYRKNMLPMENCCGPDIFGRCMVDYGPVDYLAYIGCQIYTKSFFGQLCATPVREPLYSLPIGTLELTESKTFTIGYFPEVTAIRIDVLNYGPDNPDQPPNWWVVNSRTNRGLSNNIGMSVVSSIVDCCDSAFAKLASSQIVSMRRALPMYTYWNYLSSITRQFLGHFVQAQKDPACRYTHSEVLDIVKFGQRLEKVDLGMNDAEQRKLCDWLKRFDLTEGHGGMENLSAWIKEAETTLLLTENRPNCGLWFVKKA